MDEIRKYINCSYKTLVEIFGEPTYGKSDDDKSWATWEFNTEAGWGEIYDFKSYAPSVEEVYEWHVTVDNQEVMDWIDERLYGE